MGWINSHVVTTKPITDINGHLIPKGTELIYIHFGNSGFITTAILMTVLESRKIKYQTILLDADKDLRLQRSLKRGDKVEEVLRRYDKDERDFRGVEAAICFNTTEWTDKEVTAAAEMLRDLCRK